MFWVTAEFLTQSFKHKIPVLLIGYKEVELGAEYSRYDKDTDVRMFLKLAVNTFKNQERTNVLAALSVDTALIDQHPDIVEALGAVQAQVSSPEGKFSCYIDCVDMQTGTSSYYDKSLMVPTDTCIEAFTKIYATF